MTVGLSIVLKEVGTEDLSAKRADEVIRMVLLAKSVHEGTRDGRRAVATDWNTLLLQEVNLAVGQSVVIAESRADRLSARLAGKARAFLVEEASERGNGLTLNNFLAGAAHLRSSGAVLAVSFTISIDILAIVEGLAATIA